MSSYNDVTGDELKSKANSKDYEDNYCKIFCKNGCRNKFTCKNKQSKQDSPAVPRTLKGDK